MPKYRNKARLERRLLIKGHVNALTEYLILHGYDDDTADRGLASFLEDWEAEMEWMQANRTFDMEEYEFTLYKRTQLHLVLQHATPDDVVPYSERLKEADRIFFDNTIETSEPYNPHRDEMIPDRITHWWLYRIPRPGLI